VPTDLRKGFDGLYGIVCHEMGKDPLRGDLYLFMNARRTSAKVLLWDGTGLCIYQKRLAKGTFADLFPEDPCRTRTMTSTELPLFLEGACLTDRLPLSPEEIVV
jgi:transposase